MMNTSDGFTNSIGQKFVLIPAGTFSMGSPKGESGDYDGERPEHLVTITKAFWLGAHQVTQRQWRALMGTEPWKVSRYFQDYEQNAASGICWDDAVEFCQRLSQHEGKKYRLPTEAEWEYACRAGTSTRFSFGDDYKWLPEYAWCNKNAAHIGENYAHEVGQLHPNSFGLYDMHGNVWEWCLDWRGEYCSAPLKDPRGPQSGSRRILRGGCWNDGNYEMRSARRTDGVPHIRSNEYGFRVLLE